MVVDQSRWQLVPVGVIIVDPVEPSLLNIDNKSLISNIHLNLSWSSSFSRVQPGIRRSLKKVKYRFIWFLRVWSKYQSPYSFSHSVCTIKFWLPCIYQEMKAAPWLLLDEYMVDQNWIVRTEWLKLYLDHLIKAQWWCCHGEWYPPGVVIVVSLITRHWGQ